MKKEKIKLIEKMRTLSAKIDKLMRKLIAPPILIKEMKFGLQV